MDSIRGKVRPVHRDIVIGSMHKSDARCVKPFKVCDDVSCLKYEFFNVIRFFQDRLKDFDVVDAKLWTQYASKFRKVYRLTEKKI